MSRVLVRAFAVGLVLLAIGMVASSVAPSTASTALVVAGLVLLGSLPLVTNWKSRRSPGWTRAWNPRGAQRDYQAELAARQAAPASAAGDAARQDDQGDRPGAGDRSDL